MAVAFHKGMEKTGGRKKGVKNKKTEQWEAFETFMMTTGLEQFEARLTNLKDVQYIKAVTDMMEFFKPKRLRQELTGRDGEPLTVRNVQYSEIINPRPNAKDKAEESVEEVSKDS